MLTPNLPWQVQLAWQLHKKTTTNAKATHPNKLVKQNVSRHKHAVVGRKGLVARSSDSIAIKQRPATMSACIVGKNTNAFAKIACCIGLTMGVVG